MSFRISQADAAEWRLNWKIVVASGFGLALMNMPIHSIGVFMQPLEEEFGWRRSTIASGMMIFALGSIFVGPLVGSVVDRFGPRRVALLGSVCVCAVFALFSLLTSSPVSWWIVWAILACLFPMIMPMVWTAAVSSVFTSSRGLALAVALSGTAITNAIFPIMATLLIHSYGWRAAYVGISGIFAVVVLPVIFLFFTSAMDRQRSAGKIDSKPSSPPRGLTGRAALRSFRFVRFLIASSAMIAVSSITASFVPIMMSFDHSPMIAASVASIIGIAGFVGRMSGGYLIDRVNGNLVAGGCLILPILGIAMILAMPHSVPVFMVAAVAMGLCVGAELDAVAFLTTRHFGLRSFALLFAVISAFQGMTMAGGAAALNFVFDTTQSYRWGLIGAIPVCIFSSLLFLTMGKYHFPDERAQQH